jgi:hypothetical protein
MPAQRSTRSEAKAYKRSQLASAGDFRCRQCRDRATRSQKPKKPLRFREGSTNLAARSPASGISPNGDERPGRWPVALSP